MSLELTRLSLNPPALSPVMRTEARQLTPLSPLASASGDTLRFSAAKSKAAAQPPSFMTRLGGWLKQIINTLLTPFQWLWGLITGKKPIHAASKPKAPLKPLLKLEDYTDPKGLETPLKRREKTAELVNAVFPRILKLIETRDKDPYWQVKATQIFNEELNKRIAPNLWVNLTFNLMDMEDQNPFKSSFYLEKLQSRRIETALLQKDNYHLSGFNQQDVVDVLPKTLLTQPRYYLGNLHIVSYTFSDPELNKAQIHYLLLHEVNHLMHSLAKKQKNSVVEEQAVIKSKILDFDKEMYVLGHKLFNAFLKTKALPRHAPLELYRNPPPQEKLQKLIREFQEFSSQPIGYSQLSDHLSKLPEVLPSLPPEKLKLLLNQVALNECESYLTSKVRYRPDNNKSYNLWDLEHAIKGFGFQLIARHLEERLKLPPEQRSSLTHEPFFD